MKPNDIVKFNHKYLSAIQAPKDISDMQGQVIEVVRQIKPKVFYVKVLWGGESEVKGCLSSNLAVVRSGLLMDGTE